MVEGNLFVFAKLPELALTALLLVLVYPVHLTLLALQMMQTPYSVDHFSDVVPRHYNVAATSTAIPSALAPAESELQAIAFSIYGPARTIGCLRECRDIVRFNIIQHTGYCIAARAVLR